MTTQTTVQNVLSRTEAIAAEMRRRGDWLRQLNARFTSGCATDEDYEQHLRLSEELSDLMEAMVERTSNSDFQQREAA